MEKKRDRGLREVEKGSKRGGKSRKVKQAVLLSFFMMWEINYPRPHSKHQKRKKLSMVN